MCIVHALFLVLLCVFTLGVPQVANGYSAATTFQFPLQNWNVGCNNFWSQCNIPTAHHLGEDVSASAGTSVYAIANGLVKEARYSDGYGGLVVIEHYTGSEYVVSVIGHMKSTTLAVSAGQEVTKGQLIGYVGTTAENGGWAPHVHLGIHKGSYQSVYTCDSRWIYAGYDYSGCTHNNWYVPSDFTNSRNAVFTTIQQKFADVKQRNGGSSTVGSSTNSIYWYGPYLRQDYSGGSFGTCCILYDPNNGLGNPYATNEAYLLRTGFYNFYMVNGWESFGCPSRDEYGTGAPSDAIQFFVRHVGGVTQFHYMYWENASQAVTWHSSYQTDWVSQTPGGVTNMNQGASQTFTVHFKNTGTTTWYNNAGSYPYDYISLKSVDPNGNSVMSLLNSPYSGTLGWIDDQTPCTMVEASVPPGGTATFTFTGMVAPGQQTGLMLVYFRPHHSLAGLLDDWDGMHFQVNVVAAPTTPLTTMTGPAPAAELVAMIESRKTTPLNNQNPYGFWQSPQQVSGGFNTTYWWYNFNATDPFNPDHTSKNCYVAVATGQPGAIVHDAFGSANQSFYVGWWPWDNWAHMAWNCGACPNPAGDQASGQGGPFSCLGMPITNLYRKTPTSNYGRQDFQRGYIIDGVIYCYDHITHFTPGWTPSGWNAEWSYVITDAYDRYGAAAGLGHATQLVNTNWDGTGYITQPFDGGIYGSIMLVFNPNGPRMAYGVFGSFLYAYTMGLDGSGVRISSRIGAVTEAFSGNRQQFQYGYMTINYGTGVTYVYLNDNTEIWNSQTGAHLGKLGQSTLPSVFALKQNYPNPFNPVTVIAYSLPSATHVTLEVYNLLGQKVATLIDEQQAAGEHTATWDANRFSSGVYFYRIHAGEATETKKMLLLK